VKIAQRGMPAAAIAAGSLGQWDARRPAYNFKPSNTRKLTAALGKVDAGTDACRIAMVGDSTSGGYPGPKLKAAPIAMRDYLEKMGYPVLGTGPVIGNPGGAPGAYLDERITTTGTWTARPTTPKASCRHRSPGSTLTFTSDRPGTVVEFSFLKLGAPFSYQIDGGSAVTPAESGQSTGSLGRIAVTGLSDAVHTLKITVGTLPGRTSFYLN
jgi:hypothetical protein